MMLLKAFFMLVNNLAVLKFVNFGKSMVNIVCKKHCSIPPMTSSELSD